MHARRLCCSAYDLWQNKEKMFLAELGGEGIANKKIIIVQLHVGFHVFKYINIDVENREKKE